VEFVIAPPPVPTAAIAGTDARFPVHRIYCIGRNYADHAKEMGMPVERGTPMFFCKPADALVADGATIAYPQATQDLHHEVEMVVALHSGGVNIAEADARSHIFGYGVGLDLTRSSLGHGQGVRPFRAAIRAAPRERDRPSRARAAVARGERHAPSGQRHCRDDLQRAADHRRTVEAVRA
jgi:hypothetical protein